MDGFNTRNLMANPNMPDLETLKIIRRCVEGATSEYEFWDGFGERRVIGPFIDPTVLLEAFEKEINDLEK